MESYISNAMNTLLIIWAKHYARVQNRPFKYIDRVVFNFQPGMTPKYLEYLLRITKDPNPSDFSKEGLGASLHTNFDLFLKTFPNRKTRIRIVDKRNVKESIVNATAKDTKPSIFIAHCLDPVHDEEFKSLIEICRRSEHCLIVFAEPIQGLYMYKLEDALSIKVRHLVLPNLIAEPKNYSDALGYNFASENCTACFGIPLLLEQFKNETAVNYLVLPKLVESMALWLQPKYEAFMGHFFTLFNMESAKITFTPKTKLPSSKLMVADAAAILGFEIDFEIRGRKDSDRRKEETNAVETHVTTSTTKKSHATRMPSLSTEYDMVVLAIQPLKEAFDCKFREFDTFTILRGDNLKWLELEKAIARAMTNNIEPNKKLGERWTFLSNSFFKDERADLKLNPQVIPRVKRNGRQLEDDDNLVKWTLGTRSSAPQATMKPRDWPLLFKNLELCRTILPVDKSSSPDCMFAFKDGLLCFQAKSGVQDLTMKEFIEEIGKTPFLALDARDSIVRKPSKYADVKISLVYLAQSHSIVKATFLRGFKDSDKYIDGITRDLGYIHVAYGNKILPLPDQNVEIIILLRAGIVSLIGLDGYTTLVDPLTEIKALGAQEKESLNELQTPKKPRATTLTEAKALTKKLYESLIDINGSLDAMMEALEEIQAEQQSGK